MGILDTIYDGIASIFYAILNPIIQALSNLIGTVLYYITKGLMFIVGLLHELFNVFSGSTKVLYREKYTYLSDVFFQNESVSNVYWALALLGIVLVIMFTLIAVIRKTFDLAGKQDNQSMGTLLGAMFKSIFIMLILSTALTAALDVTNLVINRIGYAFDHADSLSRQQEIHFTDEQLATMGRIYTTIGNYAINPSYDSRYNLNKCFNEIREDMNRLARQGVFDFVYVTKVNGKEVETWQSALQKLFYATNTSQNAPMDRYNEEVSKELIKIMDLLDSNASFYPLSDYKNVYKASDSVSLDKILFLSGTIGAANNPNYNENPHLLDGLRGAFYTGEKSIYSLDEVSEAFKIGVGGISYIFIWILAYFTIRNLLRCIFGCISRIFTMVSLYIMAPFAVAPLPLDNGEKFKQWTMAMVIQALGILGLIIPMRLILLFAPIIMSSDLVLFDSVVLNFVGKVLLIVGGLQGMSNLSGIITGILANNTSMAALQAGNSASAMGDKVFGMGTSAAKSAAGFAAGVAGGTLGAVSDVTGLSTVGSKLGEGISSVKNKVGSGFQNMRNNYGAVGALVNKIKSGSGGASGSGSAGIGQSGGDKGSNTQNNTNNPTNLNNMGSGQQQNFQSGMVNNTGFSGQGNGMPQQVGGTIPQQMQSGQQQNFQGVMGNNTGFSGQGGGMQQGVGNPQQQNMGSNIQQQPQQVGGNVPQQQQQNMGNSQQQNFQSNTANTNLGGKDNGNPNLGGNLQTAKNNVTNQEGFTIVGKQNTQNDKTNLENLNTMDNTKQSNIQNNTANKTDFSGQGNNMSQQGGGNPQEFQNVNQNPQKEGTGINQFSQIPNNNNTKNIGENKDVTNNTSNLNAVIDSKEENQQMPPMPKNERPKKEESEN